MKPIFTLVLFTLAIITPCWGQNTNSSASATAQVNAIKDSIRHIYAPDKRTTVFTVTADVSAECVVLKGKTDLPQASRALVGALSEKGFQVSNEILVLPDSAELGDNTWGIVDVSVCNLRCDPDYDAGQSSQAILGMPVKVLERDGWLRIQTPDRYISYVHPSSIHRVTRSELTAWNQSEQVVVTAIYGFIYSQPNLSSPTISDVVSGNRLKCLGVSSNFFHVAFPDGRKGYLPFSSGRKLNAWRKSIKRDAQSVLASARSLTGMPYMWGGTSTKGVDCSGFVRTILLMHDIIIPRDASQQVHTGEPLSILPDFSNLKPGDLLFFGQKGEEGTPDRVSHVGIYIGNQRFIHSLGWVHESSFNPKDKNYDAYNLKRLLCASRILPYINQKPLLETTDRNQFYK